MNEALGLPFLATGLVQGTKYFVSATTAHSNDNNSNTLPSESHYAENEITRDCSIEGMLLLKQQPMTTTVLLTLACHFHLSVLSYSFS